MGLAPYGEPRYVEPIRRGADRPERRRLVPAGHALLRLLRRADDDQRRASTGSSAGRRASPRRGSRSARWTSPRSIQEVTEEVDAAHGAPRRTRGPACATCAWPAAWRSTASPTAASCARDRSRTSGSSRRPATPAARSAWRSLWHRYLDQPRTSAEKRTWRTRAAPRLGPSYADGMKGAFLGPASSATARSTASSRRAARRRSPVSTTAELPAAVADLLAAEKVVGLVPGAHGVRAAGARRPQHPRRPALARDAVDDEPEDQVPRELPAVRAGGAARACAEWFELDGDSPYMLLVAPVRRARRRTMTGGGAEAVGHREAQRRALGDPGGHARRLLGARADRAPRAPTRATTSMLERLPSARPAAR